MHDYNEIIEFERDKISEIEGKILINFLVHIVVPEINIAYLFFADSIYAIHGAIGSEILQINRKETTDLDYENIKIVIFEPYSIFLNKKINKVRSIGEEWNGHGFEISFEGLYDKSMILQSIYTGETPNGFDDCIRLGIGQYYYSCEDSSVFITLDNKG